MNITVQSAYEAMKGHKPDCALVGRLSGTLSTSMCMNPEQYGLDKNVECSCGKGGMVLGMTSSFQNA